MHVNQNPATYMLEVLGNSSTDFHAYYKKSLLCEANLIRTDELSTPYPEVHLKPVSHHDADSSSEHTPHTPTVTPVLSSTKDRTLRGLRNYSALTLSPTPRQQSQLTSVIHHESLYLTSYFHQFRWVSHKVRLSYWRTPSYNFGRFMVAILIAFIFSSAYANQTYYTAQSVIARCGVIYITTLFLGVVGMQTVMPVTADELVAYYREQQSNMYSPLIYSFCALTVEIPYVIVTSLCFVLPFFYFVGFQNVGNVPAKFGYYWLFIGLYEMTLINIGQMIIASTPSQQAAAVFAGILSMLFSMFAGFTINPADIPSFFQFVYWLDPLHYAFQGIVFTQFAGDTTLVSYVSFNDLS